MKKISLFLLSFLISIVSLAESYSTIAEVKALTGENIPVTLTSGAVKVCNSNLAKEEGVNPAIKSHGSCFNVMNTEVEEIILENASIITEYDAESWREVKYVMVGEEKLRISYDGSDPLPKIATLLKGYKGFEYGYNGDVLFDAFVVTNFEVEETILENASIITEYDVDWGDVQYVMVGEEKLRISYNAKLPKTATLLKGYKASETYYYVSDPDTYEGNYAIRDVFVVTNFEVEETILENASIITEYDAVWWGNVEVKVEVKYVMVGEEKLRISYDGSDQLPKTATLLKGYKASEAYSDYDPNTNETIYAIRDVFVVTALEFDRITIADMVATTDGSSKYIIYNDVKYYLLAPSDVTIPGMGSITGYIYEQTIESYGLTLCFWVESAVITGFSTINEFKNSVTAGQTSATEGTIVDPMLVTFVYTEGEQSTLFVEQGDYSYYSIRTTTTDKNGKAYVAGDSIKGVKGFLTRFGYDKTASVISAGNHIDVEAGNIEIISSNATVPTATSHNSLAYLTGKNKQYAGHFDARYVTFPVGQIKVVNDEYYFFTDEGDSILLITPGFSVPTEYLTERVSLKAYTDVMNSGDKVQLIVPTRDDFIPSNVKFTSIADIKAAGDGASGITYELTTPALVTYIREDFDYDYDYDAYVPKHCLYIQDATGAMLVKLDADATRISTVAVGDSIVGVKGFFNSDDASVNVSVATAQHTVKNSNNPLIPIVITLKQLIEAQSAGTYNGMLVHIDSVYYVKSQIEYEWEVGVFQDIHYFIQGEDTLSYSEYKFNDGFGAAGYKFYATNHITAVVEDGWQGGQYGFWPINQAAIENTEIASGKCGDNLFWRLTPDNILTIYGEGDMYDFAPYQQPWQQYILNIIKVVFNGNATSIGSYAFADCYKTQTITFSDNIETIKFRAFSGCLNVNAIEIPASVTEIEEAAFEDCRSISELTFEEGSQLESIGSWAFYNNHALGFINLPESVREIGDAAFYGCNYVEEIVIPASVQRIGDNGFALCNQVKRMEVRATIPPTIEAKTFYQVDRNIEFVVPSNARNAYAQDIYWSEFIGETPTDVENTIDGVEIYTQNGTLYVEGLTTDYQIYNTSGQIVYSGSEVSITLPRGIYLVTINGKVQKIVL